MSTEPASVLHRFVSLANEPDYLALGWMRERPLRPGSRSTSGCGSSSSSTPMVPACRHHARPRAQRGVFGITMSTASAET